MNNHEYWTPEHWTLLCDPFRMARVKALMSKWEKHDMSKFPCQSKHLRPKSHARGGEKTHINSHWLSMVTRMRGQKIGESSHRPKSLRSSPTLTSWLEWSQQRSLAQARTFRTPYLGAGTRFFQEHLLQKNSCCWWSSSIYNLSVHALSLLCFHLAKPPLTIQFVHLDPLRDWFAEMVPLMHESYPLVN